MKEDVDYKIWYPYEIFYIESMLTIARSAMAYQTQLQITIDELENGKPNTQNETIYVIDLVQSFLRDTAALSRYFWPAKSDKIHKQRAQRLREAFEIIESSALKNRDIRNTMEHFDEALDKYLIKGVAGTFIPAKIGRRVDHQGTHHYFRAFHTDDWTFEVLGLEVKIIPIISEVIRIYLLLEKFKTEGGRLPKSNQ